VAIAYVDRRLRQARFVTGRSNNVDVVDQLKDFAFHVVAARIGREIDQAFVLKLDLGRNLVQVHQVGLGNVLLGEICGECVGTRICRIAGKAWLLHRHLRAFDYQAAELTRYAQTAGRRDETDADNREQRHGQGDRHADTKPTNVTTVP
jgi:hypothetical protein